MAEARSTRVSTPTRVYAGGALAALAFSMLLACKRSPAPVEGAPVRVAAAADLALAFEELGRVFEQKTGQRVVFSFGSTGLLAKQIREGAPFDVFAAANVSFVNEVVASNACDGSLKAPYARGRIVLWSRKEGVIPPASLADLADPRFRRIAIANPEHAPYGQAARQALQNAGLWSQLQSRIVFGENVRQTLQFAESGNADVALVALALVILDSQNPWVLVEETAHLPIDQALTVCSRGANRAGGQAFARFVNGEIGRAVMRRHGFLLPGEPSPLAP